MLCCPPRTIPGLGRKWHFSGNTPSFPRTAVLTSAKAGLTGRIGRRYELVAKQILERITPESHKDSPRLSHCPLRDRPLSQDYLWVIWILLCGLRC